MKKYEKPSIKVYALKTQSILAGPGEPPKDVYNDYSDDDQL